MTKARVSFAVYTDIHHHQWDNGLTEADVLAIEDEVCALANERDVDFTLFGGDRFFWRNPISHVRAAADEKLKQHLARRPYLAIVGNHDREAKNAHSGHSMMHLPMLLGPQLAENLIIASEAGLYQPPQIPNVAFWICPAGQAAVFSPRPHACVAQFSIGVFHDIMHGSDLGMGHKADFGLAVETLDKDYLDIVIGGDNHVHQQLPLTNTVGYYAGAPCQHNWGDVGQRRGFMHVVLEEGQPPRVEHIVSKAPRFLKFVHTLTDKAEAARLERLVLPEYAGNIVQIILKGGIEVLSKVDTTKMEKKLRATANARQLTVISDPTVSFQAIIPELQQSRSPTEDWDAYVNSGKLDTQGAPLERIKQLGQEILHEAKDA